MRHQLSSFPPIDKAACPSEFVNDFGRVNSTACRFIPSFPALVARMLFAISLLQAADVGTANAQQPRDARVVLGAGGPTSAVRSIVFSADSRRLYLTGADKSVEIWSLPEALQNAPNLKLVSHARWPIARHDRGQIWALAINDVRNQLAFGGYGAQQISGDISITDSLQGQQITILPPPKPNEDPQQRFMNGHRLTVNSASYSPNGEWLASMSLDGDLRIWSVGAWTSQQILRPGVNPGFSNVNVQFISNTQLVASITPSADRFRPQPQLILFTIGADRQITKQILNSPHEVLITALGRDPTSDRWYSGDAKGRIGIWRGSQNLQMKLPLSEMPVRAISASANGLVLTLHSPTAAAVRLKTVEKAYAELQQITNIGSTLVDRLEWNLSGETHAAAISRDGKYAALSRPGEAAVEVFAIVDLNNQLRQKPFTVQRPTILTGSGATIQRVQFTAKQPGSLLAISTSRKGEWTHGFDLAKAEVVRPGVLGVVRPAQSAAGWNLAAGPSIEAQPQAISISNNGTLRTTISVDHQIHGHYAAHSWIFENGKAIPSAVAIGTERQHGIFVFDLRQPNRAPLLRYYRDHTNTVNSLSQSPDGRYLASSSQDQTVRIWSLQGLFARPAVFPQAPAWGGEFVVRNGQLVVTSLLEFGILKGRNLKDGDQIIKIAFADPKQNGRRIELNDPQQIQKALQDLPLTESVEMHAFRPAVNNPPFIVTPGWEPIATLFIDRRNEWAAWTPAGYYNASVDGDELFGFQINPPSRGGVVQFSRAEQLREDYERPALLQELFARDSLNDAFKAVAITPRNPGAVVAQIPTVQLIAPVSMQSFAQGEAVSVVADVDYRGLPPQNFQVAAWVNGAKLGVPVVAIAGGATRYTWNVTPPPGEYQASVKVESLGPSLTPGVFADAGQPFVVSGLEQLRTIHVMAIGANGYQGNLRLNFCTSDAREFAKLIATNAGQHYKLGHVRLLVDDSPGESAKFQKIAFQNQLDEFAEQIKQSQLQPNDLVMIFIAGHGEAIGKNFYFVPPVAEIKNLAQQATIEKHSIPWSAFRRFVEAIPNCCKAVFVDTCYSGNIASLEAEKAQLRPLKNLNTVVFAATSEDQVAREDDVSRHGRFTTFLLDGLSGNADGSSVDPELPGVPPPVTDGRVSLLETVGYVSRRVYEKWRDQQPRYTPVYLLRFLNDPLVDVPQTDRSQDGK